MLLVGNVFGGRCGAEALGLGLMSLNPAYRFALPPGLAAKTTRCLTFDQAARLRRRFFGAAAATATSRHCWLYIYTETTRRARVVMISFYDKTQSNRK
uniref:Secreted protein n=1 Tax=Trichogramma kaykai TaxID=54128 RepID=A0ABD2W357_9HYME